MRTIIRCPSCFTYVYSDARQCHGCGYVIGRRRWLTRGSWVFITLAVAGFAVARSIDLFQDKRDRERRQMEALIEDEQSQAFLRRWLSASPEDLVAAHTDRRFADDLVKLRDRFPDVLPAGEIVSLDLRNDLWERHSRAGSGQVEHEYRSPRSRLRVSSAPVRSSASFWLDSGRTEYWMARTYDFEAQVDRDGQRYTVLGRVCLDDQEHDVRCLEIRRVRGIEGDIKPRE
jgi:hypothetical protein